MSGILPIILSGSRSGGICARCRRRSGFGSRQYGPNSYRSEVSKSSVLRRPGVRIRPGGFCSVTELGNLGWGRGPGYFGRGTGRLCLGGPGGRFGRLPTGGSCTAPHRSIRTERLPRGYRRPQLRNGDLIRCEHRRVRLFRQCGSAVQILLFERGRSLRSPCAHSGQVVDKVFQPCYPALGIRLVILSELLPWPVGTPARTFPCNHIPQDAE